MTVSQREPRERPGGSEQDVPGSLARKANAIEAGIGESTWPNHEYVRGFAVMVLPFSSGHLLALRAWPQSSFGPYVSVWHRPPGGEWSIFTDGPSLQTTCSRYWGAVCDRTELTNIEITWTGPNDIRVHVDEPHLVWTMSLSAPSFLQTANAVNASLPLWTWKPDPLVRMREWLLQRFLDIGDVRLSFTVPSGHDAVIVPKEEYVIHESKAVLDGRSLGEPTRLEENPIIGDVPLPTRPSFVFGQAQMRITDPDEYRRTRRRLCGDAGDRIAADATT